MAAVRCGEPGKSGRECLLPGGNPDVDARESNAEDEDQGIRFISLLIGSVQGISVLMELGLERQVNDGNPVVANSPATPSNLAAPPLGTEAILDTPGTQSTEAENKE